MSEQMKAGTVNINPASPSICYTTTIPRALAYVVMHDFYHHQNQQKRMPDQTQGVASFDNFQLSVGAQAVLQYWGLEWPHKLADPTKTHGVWNPPCFWH